jgi:hypothetical protein
VGVGVVEHCVWELCEGVGSLCGGIFYHVSKMWSSVINGGSAEQAGSIVLLCIKVV